jgi:nitrate reductase gamma subunit
MVLGWILGIALLILGLILFITTILDDKDDIVSRTCFSFSILFFGLIIVLGLSGCFDSKEPQPIDVYRNKTTLKITYQDSIPLDTVVVWKDEFKPRKEK